MANDLAAMKARIASELARSDLTTQIAAAITTAITAYQKERFRFSDINPTTPPTFNTVAARSIYTSADNANIATAFRIDYLLVNIAGAVQTLDRVTPLEIKQYNQQNTMRGQPSWWAYEGNQLMLSPVPDQVYLITMGLFREVPAPAADGEAGNPWMIDAEALIRCRAKYEIATHVTRNAVMATAMSPDPPAENGGVLGATYREWRALKRVGARITGRGMVKAMQF